MNGRVNTIGLKKIAGATLGRDWRIVIDNRDLLQLIEESAGISRWSERKDAKVNPRALSSSARGPGDYDILVCAHCAANEYTASDDLRLKSIAVVHEREYISWSISPPADAHQSEAGEPLQFTFHKSQYMEVVAKLEDDDSETPTLEEKV